MSLLWFFRKREKTRGLIEADKDLVRAVFGHEAITMRWSDIVRIEAGRKPTPTVDIFYVRLTDTARYSLEADDLMKRFSKFEEAILLRWPAIRKDWLQIFNGPPDRLEHRILWQRDGA